MQPTKHCPCCNLLVYRTTKLGLCQHCSALFIQYYKGNILLTEAHKKATDRYHRTRLVHETEVQTRSPDGLLHYSTEEACKRDLTPLPECVSLYTRERQG